MDEQQKEKVINGLLLIWVSLTIVLCILAVNTSNQYNELVLDYNEYKYNMTTRFLCTPMAKGAIIGANLGSQDINNFLIGEGE